jgi:catechol 2,3-dioxygenase-like lactoylglutathione lyase family enzyme
VPPAPTLGRVVLLVHDQQEALAFYRDVLGFAVLHDSDADGFRYLHVGLPGQPETGLWLFPGEARTGGGPLLVLYADDLDAVRARLDEHGVARFEEREDPAGRSLQFRDPAGNVLVAAETP